MLLSCLLGVRINIRLSTLPRVALSTSGTIALTPKVTSGRGARVISHERWRNSYCPGLTYRPFSRQTYTKTTQILQCKPELTFSCYQFFITKLLSVVQECHFGPVRRRLRVTESCQSVLPLSGLHDTQTD
jgi:hypothetical protein